MQTPLGGHVYTKDPATNGTGSQSLFDRKGGIRLRLSVVGIDKLGPHIIMKKETCLKSILYTDWLKDCRH